MSTKAAALRAQVFPACTLLVILQRHACLLGHVVMPASSLPSGLITGLVGCQSLGCQRGWSDTKVTANSLISSWYMARLARLAGRSQPGWPEYYSLDRSRTTLRLFFRILISSSPSISSQSIWTVCLALDDWAFEMCPRSTRCQATAVSRQLLPPAYRTDRVPVMRLGAQTQSSFQLGISEHFENNTQGSALLGTDAQIGRSGRRDPATRKKGLPAELSDVQRPELRLPNASARSRRGSGQCDAHLPVSPPCPRKASLLASPHAVGLSPGVQTFSPHGYIKLGDMDRQGPRSLTTAALHRTLPPQGRISCLHWARWTLVESWNSN